MIATIKQTADIPVLIDDNYGVMKVEKIGCECGADVSCFSTFKLQGPEGIGCVVGRKVIIDRIRKMPLFRRMPDAGLGSAGGSAWSDLRAGDAGADGCRSKRSAQTHSGRGSQRD